MITDMTTGHPLKQILKFSVPLMLGSVLQLLYTAADMMIVGQTLGKSAIAAVGNCGAPVFVILGFFWGMTRGVTIITAQRFGAKDKKGVRKSIALGFTICTAVSLVGTVIVCLLCRNIILWMHTPTDIIQETYDYMIWTFIGIVTASWGCHSTAVLRALGDSKTPLIAIAVSAVANIGMDFLFICGFHWGVAGAAIATQLAHLIAAGYCLWYGMIHYPILHLNRKSWIFDRQSVIAHCRMGVPTAIQNSIIGIGLVVMQWVVNGYGSVAVASVAVAERIEGIAMTPMFSIDCAAMTYAGQNYGAKRYDRIQTGTIQMFLFLASLSIAMSTIVIAFYPFFTRLFLADADAEVLRFVKIYMWTNPAFHLLLLPTDFFKSLLQGMGCAYAALFASFFELFMRGGAAILLGVYFSFTGVCLSNAMAWLGAGLFSTIYYFVVIRNLKRKQSLDQNVAALNN